MCAAYYSAVYRTSFCVCWPELVSPLLLHCSSRFTWVTCRWIHTWLPSLPLWLHCLNLNMYSLWDGGWWNEVRSQGVVNVTFLHDKKTFAEMGSFKSQSSFVFHTSLGNKKNLCPRKTVCWSEKMTDSRKVVVIASCFLAMKPAPLSLSSAVYHFQPAVCF